MIEKWIYMAVAVMVMIAIVQTIFKISVGKIDFVRGMLIAQTAGLVFLSGYYILTKGTAQQIFTTNGLYLMIIAGVLIGAINLLIFMTLGKGALSLTTPIMNSALMLTVLFGVVFLGEKLGVKSGLGVLLIIGGILLIATS